MAGMQYGIAAFLLPFVFPYSPGLLMHGGPLEIVLAFLTAAFGIVGIAAALVGYLFRPLNPVFRVLLFAFGCAVMPSPLGSTEMMIANIVGIAGGAVIVLIEWFASRAPVGVATGSLKESAVRAGE
jgi:TRAP-type uncharacterized transport system fused permease subunit